MAISALNHISIAVAILKRLPVTLVKYFLPDNYVAKAMAMITHHCGRLNFGYSRGHHNLQCRFWLCLCHYYCGHLHCRRDHLFRRRNLHCSLHYYHKAVIPASSVLFAYIYYELLPHVFRCISFGQSHSDAMQKHMNTKIGSLFAKRLTVFCDAIINI